MRLRHLVDRVETAERLDGLATAVTKAWQAVLPNGHAKDLLHGTWLGHPLHAVLTDVPIGCWASAGLLDATGGHNAQKAAQRLVGLGVLAAIPTAAAGAADYTSLGEADRPKRVGALHATANATATALYAASWFARRKGHHTQGVAIGTLATAALAAGGYLGGHLAYRNGIGADRTADISGPDDWTDAGNLRDLPMRQAVRRTVGGTDLLLYRNGSTVRAIAATCSHLGGPLEQGLIEDECVTCPWHGSTFDLTDGAVVHGPATHPQPAYDVRVVGRTVQVRRHREPTTEAEPYALQPAGTA
jgi:nitrite reductase/ring-hydroxylating ferredoxin subunit/uncharacterized membrane protein